MLKKNLLIQGDNIHALQWLLEHGYRGKIDLVYIDPPFATGGTFSIDNNGRVSTISKSKDSQTAYEDTLRGESFLAFLKERVILIHELLSEKGSFYLHIDYKIGHYVKVMLDSIFGIENFRNDITRIKCNPKNFERIGYGNIKDMILFYTKGCNPIWNSPRVKSSEDDIIRLYAKVDAMGRRYTTVPIHAPGETRNGDTSKPFKGILPPKGRHWRCSVEELERLDAEGLIEWSSSGNPRKINYADEHLTKKAQDIWDFKDPAYPSYPTEKNLDMLKFIIEASSNDNSLVMDCFCGSGATLQAANLCNRHWIGVDNSEIAIKTVKKRFSSNLFSNEENYQFINLNIECIESIPAYLRSRPIHPPIDSLKVALDRNF
ncbi:MAG: site-specific DNA-methyltransferase [Bacteroides sp.]|nr:site-specific DNA-methyltransferase [Bacteroides sp.]MCM1086005.1 site-specific DNA-methyltransferase [Bacteroides sp.]